MVRYFVTLTIVFVTVMLIAEMSGSFLTRVYEYFQYDRDSVTTGEILVSETVERSGGRPVGTKWSYRIEYSYAVNGEFYRGNKVRNSLPIESTESTVKEMVSKYPVGSIVDVWYPESNPSASVLEDDDMDIPILLLALVGLALIISFFLGRPSSWK